MKLRFKDLLNRTESSLILSFFIAFLFVLIYIFFTPNYYQGTSPVQFDIRKNEPFSSVVDRLYQKGIIPSKSNFRIAAFIYGAEKKIRAARYYIPNGLSYLELLDLFISGECDFGRKVTIKNGQTVEWIASKLMYDVAVDSAAFVQKAYDSSFVHSLGLNENSFEGYLFPKSYYIYEHSPPEEVLKVFYDGFKEFFIDSLKQRAEDLGMTIHEVVTLASIVEGETNNPEEMPTIAGVYHNRLMRGMKLQADPTIQYLIPGKWRRVFNKDLEIDSPYNTYMYAGLPPGPINNPGKEAILATLYPEQHKYFYFVANGNGNHKFARTYNEHLRNVREYRRWIRAQRKK